MKQRSLFRIEESVVLWYYGIYLISAGVIARVFLQRQVAEKRLKTQRRKRA